MSIQYKCIVSAPYETRNVWSLASKAVIDASASHAMTSVDEKTPPRIGVVLTRATVQDFQSLGVLVQKVTEIFGDDWHDTATLHASTEKNITSLESDGTSNKNADLVDLHKKHLHHSHKHNDTPHITKFTTIEEDDSRDGKELQTTTEDESGTEQQELQATQEEESEKESEHENESEGTIQAEPVSESDDENESEDTQKEESEEESEDENESHATPEKESSTDENQNEVPKRSGHMLANKSFTTYTIDVSDTHGLSYTGEVQLNNVMINDVTIDDGMPLALMSFKSLAGASHAFDNDVSEVRLLIDRAFRHKNGEFNTSSGCVHNVSAAGDGIIRTFPIDVESRPVTTLSTDSTTTSLFNENRVPTHTVKVHTTRLSCSQMDRGYIATQGLTLEEVGGTYSASIVMTRSAKDSLVEKVDGNVYMAAPMIPFNRSLSTTVRNSVVHAFAAGCHFAANVTHAYDVNAPRSLQLPVYALMHAVAETHPGLVGDFKVAMSTGSMETLYADSATPMVVMRNSAIPFVTVFTPKMMLEDIPQSLDMETEFHIDSDAQWEAFLSDVSRHTRDQDQARSLMKTKQEKSIASHDFHTGVTNHDIFVPTEIAPTRREFDNFNEDCAEEVAEIETNTFPPTRRELDNFYEDSAEEVAYRRKFNNDIKFSDLDRQYPDSDGEASCEEFYHGCHRDDNCGASDVMLDAMDINQPNNSACPSGWRDCAYPENVRMALLRHWNQ